MLVAKSDVKTATTVRVQRHAAEIGKGCFSDRPVALRVGQSERQRRASPVAILDLRNVLFLVDPFIMAVEIVIPDGAARRNGKACCFVRRVFFSMVEDDIAKGCAIIKYANIERVRRFGCRVYWKFPAGAAVEGLGVDAPPGIVFVDPVKPPFYQFD